jgi:potassium efflux system protein
MTVCGVSAAEMPHTAPLNRMALVIKQTESLKHRLAVAMQEFNELKQAHDTPISRIVLEKASKKLLDKAALGILVAQTNLDNINIELNDAQQTVNRLEKNVQEIQNQLNVLGMFGLKVKHDEWANVQRVKNDLIRQQELLKLEKERIQYSIDLQVITSKILQFRKDNYARLNTEFKSYRLLNIKQREINDELTYQALQQSWLKQLNALYARIAQVDPAKEPVTFMQLERDIFYANEHANLAYVQALTARYQDQLRQLQIAILGTNSISILNEIDDQVVLQNKQLTNLDNVLVTHAKLLGTHIHDLSQRKHLDAAAQAYVTRLQTLQGEYGQAKVNLKNLEASLMQFRIEIDHAMQAELSSRQSFPMFGLKMLFDLGKEALFVPNLTYHIVKNLSTNLVRGVASAGILAWVGFLFAQSVLIFLFYLLRKVVLVALERPYSWHGKINSKWLSLQWFNHNFIEMFIIGELVFTMSYFGVVLQNYVFILYLLFVWLIFKSVLTILHVCLVEATNDTTGHDINLYRRLKWIIVVGSVVTAVTVFLHQLPLVYELKSLFDRLFLLFLMVVSLLLLRSWRVFPHLVLSYMETRHPYLEKSIRLIGFLVPLLIFVNAAIGLFGYVNLVMTVSGYEGVFLVVLIAYLIIRGLLSDGVEVLSRLIVRHVSHGWLLTEAFLKPLDKILQITLFLMAGSLLFLLYGWDKQSPIVERLNTLLHYPLYNVAPGSSITSLGVIELLVVISVFYWCAKWTREFVYRLLLLKTNDMGIRNSLAILSQYSVVVIGLFICLRVLGIDLRALTFVATAFAFGVGLGLRDLANNFAAGFLILLERPIRVGDIVSINDVEGEVTHIGGRAVTIRTWDFADYVVPNTEIFNKSFTNWTFKDNIVRSVVTIKIDRQDDPHAVQKIIYDVLDVHPSILREPAPEVFLNQMNDVVMNFEIRFYVNIRLIVSRVSVMSDILMQIWDSFKQHGIEPPYPKQHITLTNPP